MNRVDLGGCHHRLLDAMRKANSQSYSDKYTIHSVWIKIYRGMDGAIHDSGTMALTEVIGAEMLEGAHRGRRW